MTLQTEISNFTEKIENMKESLKSEMIQRTSRLEYALEELEIANSTINKNTLVVKDLESQN
jgi:hypothetical protein